jgi:hypothetical protein
LDWRYQALQLLHAGSGKFFLKVDQTGVVDYDGSFPRGMMTGAAGSWTFSGPMTQDNLSRMLIRRIYETTRADSGDVAARRSEPMLKGYACNGSAE